MLERGYAGGVVGIGHQLDCLVLKRCRRSATPPGRAKLGFLIVAAMAIAGCDHSTTAARKDSGAPMPPASDTATLLDLIGQDAPTASDDIADATVDARYAGPDAPSGRDEEPDGAMVDEDVGADVPYPDRGAIVDAAMAEEHSAWDGGTDQKGATDRVRNDVTSDGSMPRQCTGRFTLGGILPMGKTGAEPSSVALADLDGDGKLDLVTANVAPATVSVLVGRGDGTFAAQTDYAIELANGWAPPQSSPSSLALGDVNGDGKLDIAVVEELGGDDNAGLVVVLLGKGDGTFPGMATYPADQGPASLALGDVNGDGKLDIVSANHDSDTVSVSLGPLGERGIRCLTGHGPATVLLGDVNGDGKSDYVTVNLLAGTVSVLPGKGDGTCAGNVETPIGRDVTSSASSAALGDTNGDGKLDLVVTSTSPSTVSVLLGKGDGSFPSPVDYPVGDGPALVALRDLDRDGKLDILVAASVSGTVAVLLGRGDGTFSAKLDYPGVISLRSAALGDLDGDGNLDLAMAGPINYYRGWTSVLLGTGPGTFVRRSAYPTQLAPSAIALADLDGDGRLDVTVVGSQGDSAGKGTVLLGSAAGFAAKADFAVEAPPSSIVLGDMDGDGRLDLVVGSHDAAAVSVLPGAGDGTFAGKADFATDLSPASVALADLDDDGMLDVVTVGYQPSSQSTVSVLLGTGGGQLAAPTDYGVNRYPVSLGPQSVALGELTGDGNLDIAVVLDSAVAGSVVTMPGRGDGTFDNNKDLGGGAASPGSLVLADLNGDGSLDVITSSAHDGRGDGWVQACPRNGTFNGARGCETYATIGFATRPLAVGDINHDGILDIMTGTNAWYWPESPGTISVLLGNGDGTFAPALDYPAAAVTLALGDVDGDGDLEMVTATPSGSIEILEGVCETAPGK
jgi:hypothetical protein